MFAYLNRTAGIPLRYANRHGLISGPTGTGKTVSLMRLAEQFSSAGIPVFVADVKGDIAALSRSCPAELLDLFGTVGRPLQTSVDAMGPDLMARVLELTDTQAGALEIAFAHARDIGLPLATLQDLRHLLAEIHGNRESVSRVYGQVSAASLSVIQRSILRLESQGAGRFFGRNVFDVAEMLQPGLISILAADRLMTSPRVYSAFLLWMLTDLYDRLPEIGDSDKPRLVFFFDESHLLFQDCPTALLRRIEQTARLIRSKGVGIYFASQKATDVPETVRDQLAHVVEHSRGAAVGTARFATMDQSGRPVPAQNVRVELPSCSLGALSAAELEAFAPRQEGMPDASNAETALTLPRGLEFALYGFAVAVLVSIAAAVYWIAQAGALGTATAIAIGAVLALRGRLR